MFRRRSTAYWLSAADRLDPVVVARGIAGNHSKPPDPKHEPQSGVSRRVSGRLQGFPVLDEKVLALALGEVAKNYRGVLGVLGDLRKWGGSHNVSLTRSADNVATVGYQADERRNAPSSRRRSRTAPRAGPAC